MLGLVDFVKKNYPPRMPYYTQYFSEGMVLNDFESDFPRIYGHKDDSNGKYDQYIPKSHHTYADILRNDLSDEADKQYMEMPKPIEHTGVNPSNNSTLVEETNEDCISIISSVEDADEHGVERSCDIGDPDTDNFWYEVYHGHNTDSHLAGLPDKGNSDTHVSPKDCRDDLGISHVADYFSDLDTFLKVHDNEDEQEAIEQASILNTSDECIDNNSTSESHIDNESDSEFEFMSNFYQNDAFTTWENETTDTQTRIKKTGNSDEDDDEEISSEDNENDDTDEDEESDNSEDKTAEGDNDYESSEGGWLSESDNDKEVKYESCEEVVPSSKILQRSQASKKGCSAYTFQHVDPIIHRRRGVTPMNRNTTNVCDKVRTRFDKMVSATNRCNRYKRVVLSDDDDSDDFGSWFFIPKAKKGYGFPKSQLADIDDVIDFWETDFQIGDHMIPKISKWEMNCIAPNEGESKKDYQRYLNFKKLYGKWVKCNKNKEQWYNKYMGYTLQEILNDSARSVKSRASSDSSSVSTPGQNSPRESTNIEACELQNYVGLVEETMPGVVHNPLYIPSRHKRLPQLNNVLVDESDSDSDFYIPDLIGSDKEETFQNTEFLGRKKKRKTHADRTLETIICSHTEFSQSLSGDTNASEFVYAR